MAPFNKSSTSIEIRLNEEKFYYPKQPIEGVVQVHPKKPTKANHIRVTFTGEIFLAIKEKETINLFTYAEELPMSRSGKTKILEAKQHEFPFKFIVPDDLPSTFQLRRPKAWIKYTLTAVLVRPVVMGVLSPKATYPVQVLEFIDVESREFSIPREQNLDFALQDSKPGQQCHLKVTMPKIGYTRGDVVKLRVTLNHYEPAVRKEGIKVELMRMVGIQTTKNAHSGEEVLKEQWHDVNIAGPSSYVQTFDTQIIIPTSTPPSIMFKGLSVQFYYRIRIGIYLNNDTRGKVESHRIDMPIIVGTWPKADLPIDDEDEDVDEDSTPWETADEDNLSDSYPPFPQPTPSHSIPLPSRPRRSTGSSSTSPVTASPVSAVTIGMRNISTSTIPTNISMATSTDGTATVARSDSNVSHSSNKSGDSTGSHRSSQSYYINTRSPTLSFSTHGSTNITSPEPPNYPIIGASSPHTNNGAVNPSNLQVNHPLNRSSSTPDLVKVIPLTISNTTYGNTYTTATGHRSSLCNSSSTTVAMSNNNSSNNVISFQPIFTIPATPSQHQNRVQISSKELVSTQSTTMGRASGTMNMQPRVLQPISATSAGAVIHHTTQSSSTTTAGHLSSSPPPMVTNLVPRIHRLPNDDTAPFEGADNDRDPFLVRSNGDMSSSEESDSEDLLQLIERKKKLEAKRSSYQRRLY